MVPPLASLVVVLGEKTHSARRRRKITRKFSNHEHSNPPPTLVHNCLNSSSEDNIHTKLHIHAVKSIRIGGYERSQVTLSIVALRISCVFRLSASVR